MNYQQRIKDLRTDKDKTQQDIADIIRTSRTYYNKYEKGTHPLPIEHLITLCKYYDVSADYVLGFTNEPKSLPKS